MARTSISLLARGVILYRKGIPFAATKRTKSAERSIITYINEHEKVVKIGSKIYSRGEVSDSPEGFGFKRTEKID